MTAHYICDNVRGHGHIRMFTKISTDGESLAVPFDKVFNQFNLGSKLVGITSDGGPNLARWNAILDIIFDNKIVFDLKKPMFVMECLAHFFANACNSVLMDVKYDDSKVYIEVTRRNMQRWII